MALYGAHLSASSGLSTHDIHTLIIGEHITGIAAF
jgi:hypothetical protein